MTSSFFNSNVNTLSLYALLQQVEHNVMSKLNCVRVGIVDEVLTDNIVKCSIGNKKLKGTNADGSAVWGEYPAIYARLLFIGNSANYMNLPVQQKQLCLLIFCDREINSVMQTGQVSPLNSTRMHSLSDCFCIPLSTVTIDDFFNIVAPKIKLTGTTTVDGDLTAKTLNAKNGETGSFISQDNKTITVVNGIITRIA